MAPAISWTGYTPFDPGFDGDPHTLPRREAKQAFDRLMDARASRIAALRALLAENGEALDETDAGLLRLEAWFRAVVAANAILSDVPGRMRPEWHSVVRDLGLFIGETIIGRSDGQLHWAFFEKGRRDVAFQRHVLMGFSRAANPKYNVNPEAIVGMLAHSLAQRDRFAEPPVPEGRFLRVVQTALEYA